WLITYINTMSVLSLIRRDALLAAGGWRSGVLHEDWDLWMSFAERRWSGVRVPRVVAYYRPNRTGRWAASRNRYDEALASLRRDHPELYAARTRNRKRSSAPRRLKWALPVVDRLPLSEGNKLRLGALIRRLVAEEADDGVRKRRSVVGDEQLLTRCGLDRSESGRRRDDRKRTRHRLEDLVLDPGAGTQRHDGDGRFVQHIRHRFDEAGDV